MIVKLLIENLVLVERAEMNFSKGFNVLTGETGAGKSAVMAALSFLMGKRQDVQLIRKGAEKGVVEGHFEAPLSVANYLKERGISHDPGDALVIKRELKIDGKGAIFINQQRVQGHVLKELGGLLITQVGQLAIMTLFDPENQLKLLDLFGEIDSQNYKKVYLEEKKLEDEVAYLKKENFSKDLALSSLDLDIEEIESAHLKEGEEEELFQEYTRLNQSEQLASLVQEWLALFSEEGGGLERELKRAKRGIDQLFSMDESLKGAAESVKTALLELQEVVNTLSHYESRLEFSPKRLNEIDEKLSLIARLKRKWGKNTEEILSSLDALKTKRKKLLFLEDELISLEEKLSSLRGIRQLLSRELTEKRREGALKLTQLMTNELKKLNMPGAHFSVEVKQSRGSCTGEDFVEFTLSANLGEKALPLRQAASGGEISRVMLAFYALLAEKEETPILIFDEIDANIGGETAQIIGEKLKEIGKNHQVLCITHFPQTAKSAITHFRIRKVEEFGRTLTKIELLSKEMRRDELKRMVGGEVFV